MRHIKRSRLFSQNKTAPFSIHYADHEERFGVPAAPHRAEAPSPLRGGNPHKAVITDAYFVTHMPEPGSTLGIHR